MCVFVCVYRKKTPTLIYCTTISYCVCVCVFVYRIVNHLNKLVQGSLSEEEQYFQIESLKCLVSILEYMVHWCQDLDVSTTRVGDNSLTAIGEWVTRCVYVWVSR